MSQAVCLSDLLVVLLVCDYVKQLYVCKLSFLCCWNVFIIHKSGSSVFKSGIFGWAGTPHNNNDDNNKNNDDNNSEDPACNVKYKEAHLYLKNAWKAVFVFYRWCAQLM